MILSVSPNTAVDRVMVVDRLHLGAVHRIVDERQFAGGKPVNVARFVRALGGEVRLVALIGGRTGSWAKQLAEAEGLSTTWVETPGESRICDVMVERHSGRATVINGERESVPMGAVERFKAVVERRMLELPQGSMAVLSGSLPAGFAAEWYANLAAKAAAAGVAVGVDAHGQPLARILAGEEAAPTWLKANREEFAQALGGKSLRRAAERLLSRGSRMVVVTDGGRGGRAWAAGRQFSFTAVNAAVKNPTGCGDAFLAGLVMATTLGLDEKSQLAFASAAAGLKVAQEMPSLGDGHVVSAWERTAAEVTVEIA